MNYSNETLLEMVELYAEEMGLISSEDELSERFDEYIEDVGIVDTEDTVMIDESFSNWSDSLCSDNIIHPEQYNNYSYVGIYSE